MARVLILTLSSGEAALPVLVDQLANQTFQDFEHQVIAGLPNRAAHNRLYRTIAECADRFDIFVKLDADMTLRSSTSLDEAVRAVERYPRIQHFNFPLWDCFTEQVTLGISVFRSGVTWGEVSDDLFVDPDPPHVARLVWDGPPAPFVNHGEVVTDFECFSFGVHKFLKVAQRGRQRQGLPEKPHKALRHMHNCSRIRALCRTTRARRHHFALAGVVWAMETDVSSLISKAALQQVFESEIADREAEWHQRVERFSRSAVAWRLGLLRALGVRRAFLQMG